ncbi:hypothetical protein BH23ACT10_BH23ACT10_10370 [soil metagenome]
MSVVQVWLLVGVPVLVAALALFTARSSVLAPLGVLAMLAGAVAVASADRASAAVLGVIAVLLYATGGAGRAAVAGNDPVRGTGTVEETNSA